jgi:hypothetical protein
MKYNRILTVLFICATVGFTSCTKDKEKDNYFEYSGTIYHLVAGTMQYYGQLTDGAGYNFDISLFSSGVTYDFNTADLGGTGNAVYFEMFSSSDSELPDGEYSFDVLATESPLTFDEGYFGININFDSHTGAVIYITSGNVTVAKSGLSYELTFDCFAQDGEPVSGHFKGILPYYDMNSPKK